MKCADCRELRERLKSVERQRDQYRDVVSLFLDAVSRLATGTLAGGALALAAKSVARQLRAPRK